MPNSTSTAGTPISIQWRKLISTPSRERMKPDPDHIGRRADRRGQTSDRGRERGHQHEPRRVAGIDDRALPAHGGENGEADPEHHGGGGGVGDPPGDEGGYRAEGEQDPAGPCATQGSERTA